MTNTVEDLVGRCVGVPCKNGRGLWWATIDRVQLTHLGLRLWVSAGSSFGAPRWVDARTVKTRAKRDQRIIDTANAGSDASASPTIAWRAWLGADHDHDQDTERSIRRPDCAGDCGRHDRQGGAP